MFRLQSGGRVNLAPTRQPAGFDELKQTLLEEYDVTTDRCTEELRELMQVLVDHGLVRHSNSNSGVS